MTVVKSSEVHPGHIDLVHKLHNVLIGSRATSEQAISAASELLALVLINSCETQVESMEMLASLNSDMAQFLSENWPTAAVAKDAARAHGGKSKGNH